jgi:hypothetical protein
MGPTEKTAPRALMTMPPSRRNFARISMGRTKKSNTLKRSSECSQQATQPGRRPYHSASKGIRHHPGARHVENAAQSSADQVEQEETPPPQGGLHHRTQRVQQEEIHDQVNPTPMQELKAQALPPGALTQALEAQSVVQFKPTLAAGIHPVEPLLVSKKRPIQRDQHPRRAPLQRQLLPARGQQGGRSVHGGYGDCRGGFNRPTPSP